MRNIPIEMSHSHGGVIFKYNTATASGVDLLTLVASYYYPMRMMMHSVSLLEWRGRGGGGGCGGGESMVEI